MTTAAQVPPPPASAPDFESIYAEARRDTARVPWDDGRPHPALVAWLNVVAPSLVRCGSRVAVVGCGLGDDARELRRRGYDVTAFDWSATAIAWAREIDPASAECFHVADLFALPARWNRRFDLVVEINTIQALPPDRRGAVVGAIAPLLAPHGRLLVICRARENDAPMDGPPWPLACSELLAATASAGLVADRPIEEFLDDEEPPVRRMRGLFRRNG